MKTPLKIFFISGMQTNASTGEFSQLLSFIKDLGDEFIYKIYINRSTNFHFNSNNIIFYDNELQLKNYVEDFKPDIIILSEYQHMVDVFLDYLSSVNTIIATIDHSGLARHIYTGIPNKVIYLKPCPLSNPDKNTLNDKYWSLHKTVNISTSRIDINSKYNLKKNEKVIFMSIAPWQYETSVVYGRRLFYEYLVNLLINCFIRENKDISFFLVSSIKSFNTIKKLKKDKLNVFFFDSMNNTDYNNLLLNSDLVLSDNITQVSLSKAFMKDINVLSLINTLSVNLTFMKPFKFNVFPFDYDFLRYLYRLEYCQLITKAEVFDEIDLAKKINFLLDNKLNNIHQYIEKCNNLLSSSEIIKEIVLEHK